MLGDKKVRFASGVELRKSGVHVASRATSACLNLILSRAQTFAYGCRALTLDLPEIHLKRFVSAMQGGRDSFSYKAE